MSPKKFKRVFRHWLHWSPTGSPIGLPGQYKIMMHISYTDSAGPLGWFTWFAWYPVQTIGGKWRWLSTIYKRRFVGAYDPCVTIEQADQVFWAYGDEFDYLRDP